MAKDLNKVLLTGRLGADPEMRFTPQGTPVTTFRVASGRVWTGADGEKHEDTEWFRIVAWNKLAEICTTWLGKGDRVYIEGRLQRRQWQDHNGQDRYTTEVIAQDMIILESRGSALPADADSVASDEAEPVEESNAAGPRQPASAKTADPAPRRSTPAPAARAANGNAAASVRSPLSRAPARAAGGQTAIASRKGSFEEEELPF